GWGGIRTHETLAGLPVFKTGAINHSATHPRRVADAQAAHRNRSARASQAGIALPYSKPTLPLFSPPRVTPKGESWSEGHGIASDRPPIQQRIRGPSRVALWASGSDCASSAREGVRPPG